jgi:Rps23 Pro-64 3,4-dihydroxylase Tpa1-like proline 4-hydroxylase
MNHQETISNEAIQTELLYRLPSKEHLESLTRLYAAARPFPHVVLDNLLSPSLNSETIDFPDLDWPGWQKFQDSYQFGKRVCNDIKIFPYILRSLVHEACEPRFLRFLERLTGIEGLIPDPYLTGGGLHSSGPGGILAPHTDFHIYDTLSLYRRLNLIIYFNADWTESDGGALELSAKGDKSPTVSVIPTFGRVVVFNTDDGSVHGFTRPIAEQRRRNSLALYYYTAQETRQFSGDRTTHWQTHGSHGSVHRLRVSVYRTLLLASRALSKLAHIANPNTTAATRGVTTSEDR